MIHIFRNIIINTYMVNCLWPINVHIYNYIKRYSKISRNIKEDRYIKSYPLIKSSKNHIIKSIVYFLNIKCNDMLFK